MVRELIFVRHLASNQWRSLLFGKKSSNSMIFYLIVLSPFIFYKYFQFLTETKQLLIQRTDYFGLTILVIINIIAWLLPAWSAQQISFQLKINRYFPFNIKSLFVVKILSFFLLPTTVFAIVFSGLSFYPIFCAADFATAVLYTIGLIGFSVFVNLTFINILNLRGGRPLIFTCMILSTAGLMLSGIALSKFRIVLSSFLLSFLFDNRVTANTILIFTSVISLVAANFISLKVFLEQEASAENSKLGQGNVSAFDYFWVSRKFGLLIKKDIKYFFSLSLTPYISLLITVYYAYFLTLSNENGYQSLSVLLSFIFMPHLTTFFNFFGFDKISAIERYAVSPISPSKMVQIKNIAVFLVSLPSCIILLPVILFKFNLIVALALTIKWSLLVIGHLFCGNIFSLILPFSRRKPGGFPSKLFFGYAGASLINSFTLILADSLGHENLIEIIWLSCLILFAYILMYFITLQLVKEYLHRYWETIREAVS